MSCPICAAETHQDYKPFCSKRCADVDLGRWLGGSYAIPSRDPEDQEKLAEAMIEELENRERQKPH